MAGGGGLRDGITGGPSGAAGVASHQGQPAVHCLIPRHLAPSLHDTLARHFAKHPSIEVLVERRGSERRSRLDRRRAEPQRPAPPIERRVIRALAGRRIADRRATAVPTSTPTLPRKARPHADDLVFVERLEPSVLSREDDDTARVVTRIQSGDRDAFAIVFTRYFDRIYSYLRVSAAGNHHVAEDATHQVFVNVFEALPRYERRSQPFRVWLFAVARNYAVSQLERQRGREVLDPEAIERHYEQASLAQPEPDALSWISDRELLMFVERLSLAHRQVLLLRYTMGFKQREVAEILGRSLSDVSNAESRALRFLRDRLSSVGRGPKLRRERAQVCRPVRKSVVLRSRRSALLRY